MIERLQATIPQSDNTLDGLQGCQASIDKQTAIQSRVLGQDTCNA